MPFAAIPDRPSIFIKGTAEILLSIIKGSMLSANIKPVLTFVVFPGNNVTSSTQDKSKPTSPAA
jgi:hypothetical protein